MPTPPLVREYPKPSIIHLERSRSSLELHQQLHGAIAWLSQNMDYMVGSLPFPGEFNLIEEITPFSYMQGENGSEEFRLYAGFTVSFKEYSGSVLVFHNHDGLTAETLNGLYEKSLLPLSACFEIIVPA